MARISTYSFDLENYRALGAIAAKEGQSREVGQSINNQAEREAWLNGYDSVVPMAVIRGDAYWAAKKVKKAKKG